MYYICVNLVSCDSLTRKSPSFLSKNSASFLYNVMSCLIKRFLRGGPMVGQGGANGHHDLK